MRVRRRLRRGFERAAVRVSRGCAGRGYGGVKRGCGTAAARARGGARAPRLRREWARGVRCGLECGEYGLGDGGGGGVAAEVGGTFAAGGEGLDDGVVDGGGGFRRAEVIEHHGCREDGGHGVGDAFTEDVGGGTVDGFEHGGEAAGGVEIGAGGEADGAGNDGGEVAEDIAEQVGCDDDIEGVGAANEVHGGGIDEEGLGGDVGELGGDVVEGAVPEDHAVALGVGLGDGSDAFAAIAAAGEFEGVADDAFAAATGEDRCLDGDFVGLVVIEEAADLRVLAFGVFADDDHVDIAGVAVGERGVDAVEEDGRADVGELIEAAADGEEQAVEGDVVGDIDVADGAEEDGVVRGELFEGVGGHHGAVLEVIFGAPIKVGEVEVEGELLAGGAEDVEGGWDDFLADAVAGDDRDAEVAHRRVIVTEGRDEPDWECVARRMGEHICELLYFP